MNLKELLKEINLNMSDLEIWASKYSPLSVRFKIIPIEFLGFAEEDIRTTDARSLVNSLSNAKRAIDSQIDKICICFALEYKKRHFPQKLELLSEINIVAPNIIRKVNEKRNYLEHEYRLPKIDEVNDAIDIASLFIESSDRILNLFPEDILIGNIKQFKDNDGNINNGLRIIYRDITGNPNGFIVSGYKDGNEIGQTIVSVKNEGDYKMLLRLFLSIGSNKNRTEVATEFLQYQFA